MAASSRIGMGALAYDGGVTVRVWGTIRIGCIGRRYLQSMESASGPLAREDNGYWSTDVPGAELGNH
jgi:1,4-alpha-glucan branching enzyme